MMGDVRRQLVKLWEAIPDRPPAGQVTALCARADGLVYLIGWVDRNPSATLAQYKEEEAWVRQHGPRPVTSEVRR